MANYRTVRVLKSYKGVAIERLHTNGKFFYLGYYDKANGESDVITADTLKELKREINKMMKGDK